jgi:hypothetical protein
MGFLDSLFGGRKNENLQVTLPKLQQWLTTEMGNESAEVVSEASDAIASIGEVVGKLQSDLLALQAAGANEVHPRYDKIVKTARPAYVKSVSIAIEGLQFRGENLDEIKAYRDRLATALDALGKAGFGDGKFLMFAFQDEMKRIQGGCKRLLEMKEVLDGILVSNDRLKSLTDIKAKQGAYLDAITMLEGAKADSLRQEEDIRANASERGRLESELGRLRNGPEYAKVGMLKLELAAAQDGIRTVESEAHHALGPLKSSLRKYGKTAYDANKGRLALALEEDSVATFFAANPQEVGAVLDGIEESINKGSITIKDSDKVLRRISDAKSVLTEAMISKRDRLANEEKRINDDLNAITAVCTEEKILSDIRALEAAVERIRAEQLEVKKRAAAFEGESALALESLRKSLLEFGVDLIIA